ncbi:AC2 [Jatropha yellow mosaic virus]|uniref:Transcriptional activator protein n=1 Tax=Jatropha yellow mosaic virus TaxID=1485012 RepID=B6DXE7_9GEMI|nr:AC2 [Jatropha yellow mosaic virus]ACI15831.2 AC2 [Jatropha yellow mosaic virus]
MSCSSSSQNLYTQVPIKVQHRIAKKRSIRRGVDLKCGCSYFLSLTCANHGFTHRGTHHCSSFQQWRLYLDGPKSPILPRPSAHEQALPPGTGHHTHPNTIQSQSQASTTDTQVLPELQSLDSFTDSDWEFLTSL